MLNKSSILNISVFCPWNFAGERCLKLIQLYLWRLKDIFEENKQGFDGKSCTLTHFVAFEEHIADKCLAKPSRSLLLTALSSCNTRRLHHEDQLRFSNSKHFHFYWTKKHFISEWYFTKKPWDWESCREKSWMKSWNSRQNRELGPAWGSKSNCWSFRHVYRLDESKSFKCS